MAGGKSFLLRWAALLYLVFLYKKYGIRNIPIGLFSEDYPTLKDRQIARIKREFPPWMGQLRESKDEGHAFFLCEELGGGRILLRNLDDPSKYMSSEFAGIFVEELTRNVEQTFEDLRNRLRYPGIEEVKFMGATNPGGIGHGWVRNRFVDKTTHDPEQDRFFYIHANAYDNKHISPTYLKQLEALPENKKKAYLYGSWDVFAGQYYSEFSRDLHVVPQFIPNKKNIYMFVGGLDWGRVDPFGFMATAIQKRTSEDGVTFFRAYTFMETYGTERSPKDWGRQIMSDLDYYNLTLHDFQFIQSDTQIFNKSLDMSRSIADQFIEADEQYRIALRPASKDRIPGWENLHDWLSIAPDGIPYWVITENCKNLIRTLPLLVHDEIKIEDVEEQGMEDHLPSAARYQFKALTWIDAKVGGVGKTKSGVKLLPTATMDDGRQVSVSVDKFASAWDRQVGRYQKRGRV